MNYQLYNEGNGVEEDEKKEVYHSDQAAIGGNPSARNNLGCKEWKNGNSDRTVKHWIIAANLGHDGALKTIRGYTQGGWSEKRILPQLFVHTKLP